ncbi:head-tail adaptor protein [Alteriqipengyuania sp.]|uniref:phage head completion protein n=1 Tax=Alteriqipengyuania sp. TaxID=2800692 RepID=UPI003516AA00
MFTPAGRRDRKIVFRSNGPTKSATGEMVPGGGDVIATAMAQVNFGKGSERRQAAAESSEATATARVPATARTKAVTAEHIAEMDGATWNVTGNVPWGRGERDITMIRKG